MAEAPLLIRERAFAPFIAALAATGDIALSDRVGLGLAAIFASGSREDRIERVLDVTLPTEPAAAAHGDRLIVGTGPGAWLALRDNAPPDWASTLETALAGAAMVVDQSSGYAVLRLEGDAVWRLLAKGAFIDLDPQAFPPGRAAATVIAHIGVILWRRPDIPVFELAVFRSYVDSFWHWLTNAADAEGLRLARS